MSRPHDFDGNIHCREKNKLNHFSFGRFQIYEVFTKDVQRQHGPHILKSGPYAVLGLSFSLSSLDGECLPIESLFIWAFPNL
jgi:hypothetical protein